MCIVVMLYIVVRNVGFKLRYSLSNNYSYNNRGIIEVLPNQRLMVKPMGTETKMKKGVVAGMNQYIVLGQCNRYHEFEMEA